VARAVVVDGNAGGVCLAFVSIGLTIAATDRVPDVGTTLRNRHAASLEITAAMPRRQLAEFIVVATKALDPTADLVALPTMLN
jgi:hypothetical protein